MNITNQPFGHTSSGHPVTAWTLENASGSRVILLDYGATVQSLLVPDRSGNPVDVVLGYDTVAEYEKNGGYLGATIGRVGNRIGRGQFRLNGTAFQLAVNDGDNHLHGGNVGFDKCMWQAEPVEGGLRFSRLSPHGEEGYPGNLQVSVTFTLSEDNALSIHYHAISDRDTLVNLTNHSYFNLNGGGSALNHCLQLFATRFCENDTGCLPTGQLIPVEGTPFDFRTPKPMGQDIEAQDVNLQCGSGYDHNFVLSDTVAAILYSPETGIEMTTLTDLPGVQLYTGNFLTGWPGKGGVPIPHRGAVCLETQLFPDGINHYGFPSPILRAGEVLDSTTTYRFTVRR